MKTFLLTLAIVFTVALAHGQAVNTWTKKADFGGLNRPWAAGFSIGNKGYVGTGSTNIEPYSSKDFWEFDPALNTWSQKADFGGEAREGAVGFSIGSKGYLGTGAVFFPTQIYYKDFWEYDPTTNMWTQKADFGGGIRETAVGFSIDSKGYIGTGDNSSNLKKDFWEYNPTTNTWTQKTDFGGTARAGAIAFSIGSKGYMGTGYDNNENCKDFWEYDPATNVWIKKADFGGGTRYYAAGFSIGNKGYIGTGSATDFFGSWTKDFWEYDPSNNTWIKKKDFGGNVREAAVGFSIGTNGYITTGYGFGGFYYKDIWEYKTVCNGSTVYADTDHDGYGDAGNSYFAADCIVPQGYVTNSTDCNDADINIFPGAAEYCNSMDDDCDGELDENCIPINLVSSNITSNSVQLDWSFATCALSYKVIYRIKNSGAPWTNVSAPTNTLLLTGLVPGTTYSWEVKSKCGVNPSVVSDWSVKEHFTTAAMKNSKVDELHQSLQISPNPCTVDATIHFSLGTCSDNLVQSSYVTVKIFDVNGKEIQTLVNETVDSGDHSLLINTTGFAKGIYFVRMITENGIQNQKLIVQ